MGEASCAVAEAAATVNQVGKTAAQAAQRARDVGDDAPRNREIGQAGRLAIEGSIAALDRLNGQVEQAARNLDALGHQLARLGQE